MTTQLITIGSCLSFVIACHYNRLSPVQCLSSTRHNRVDKIVKTYLHKTEPELPESMISLLRFNSDNGEVQEIIENQFSNQNLGKTALSPEKAIGLGDIVDYHPDIDLILYDSYCDLLFKLLIPKQEKGTLFLNTASCQNWRDLFILEQERLHLNEIANYYAKFVQFFKQKNKKTKIVFVNFPFLNHQSELIRHRNQQLNQIFVNHPDLKENAYFIPAIDIPPEYWLDVTHFKYHNHRNLYDDYALIVKLIMEEHWTPQEWQSFVQQQGKSLLDKIRFLDRDFPGYRLPVYSLNCQEEHHKPKTVKDYLNQGNVLKEAGKIELAIEQYSQALQLNPNLVSAIHQMANLYEEKQQFNQAIASLKKIVQLQPGNHVIQIKLARILKQQGRIQEAIKTYQKVTALQRNQLSNLYCELAETLEENHQISDAIIVYQAVNKVIPKHQVACERLNLLTAQQQNHNG